MKTAIPVHRQQQADNQAIYCHSLTKTYGSGASAVKALRGINLEVERDELFMLVGPSGCGKTTLVSVLSALLNADEGVCRVLGHDLLSMSDTEKNRFRRQSIGFVFQQFNLLPALTALENVAMPLFIQNVDKKQALQRAQVLLQAVGLEARSQNLPAQMSGGQQQRVAIARALVHEPPLLVCDEPTSSLDHASGQQVMELLSRFVHDGQRTLLIVTHDNRIYHYADHIAHMEDGQITHVEEKTT